MTTNDSETLAATAGEPVSIRGVLAQKFWGHCPISPFVAESIFSVIGNQKEYILHIVLYLKSIISRVANSVMG